MLNVTGGQIMYKLIDGKAISKQIKDELKKRGFKVVDYTL